MDFGWMSRLDKGEIVIIGSQTGVGIGSIESIVGRGESAAIESGWGVCGAR
jgi:hypothetical protein